MTDVTYGCCQYLLLPQFIVEKPSAIRDTKQEGQCGLDEQQGVAEPSNNFGQGSQCNQLVWRQRQGFPLDPGDHVLEEVGIEIDLLSTTCSASLCSEKPFFTPLMSPVGEETGTS